MNYYNDVYLKRVNRFGNDYQARVQGQREKVFEDLLLKSSYRVDFVYNNESQPGLLERYKQDDTKTIQYLLTRVNLNMPNGTLLDIPDKDLIPQRWMVFYLESIQSSGYNRYFVLKITHTIKWYKDNNFQSTPYVSYGYLFGPHNAAMRDTNKDTNKGDVPFLQNDGNYYIIMPSNSNLLKDNYFEITSHDSAGIEYTENYRIQRIDRQTNPGIQYVTIDPIYTYDKSPIPTRPVQTTMTKSTKSSSTQTKQEYDPGYDWFDGNFGGGN